MLCQTSFAFSVIFGAYVYSVPADNLAVATYRCLRPDGHVLLPRTFASGASHASDGKLHRKRQKSSRGDEAVRSHRGAGVPANVRRQVAEDEVSRAVSQFARATCGRPVDAEALQDGTALKVVPRDSITIISRSG